MTPKKLIEELIEKGGAIVSSGGCSEMEIVQAQACGRFAVDDDGYGFVRRPKEWLDKNPPASWKEHAYENCQRWAEELGFSSVVELANHLQGLKEKQNHKVCECSSTRVGRFLCAIHGAENRWKRAVSGETPTAICEVCNWTNMGCLKVQDKWMCHGCICRLVSELCAIRDKYAARLKDQVTTDCGDFIKERDRAIAERDEAEAKSRRMTTNCSCKLEKTVDDIWQIVKHLMGRG